MDYLLQPTHLIAIGVIVIVIFGPGRFPDLGKGLARGMHDIRRGPLHMAKGVDPSIGHDVYQQHGDAPWEHLPTALTCLLAFVIGSAIYFLAGPLLPATARLDSLGSPGLPIAVDLWFCLAAFGILHLRRWLRDGVHRK